jgi:hypothetical protein
MLEFRILGQTKIRPCPHYNSLFFIIAQERRNCQEDFKRFQTQNMIFLNFFGQVCRFFDQKATKERHFSHTALDKIDKIK